MTSARTIWYFHRSSRRALVILLGVLALFIGADVLALDQGSDRLEAMRLLLIIAPREFWAVVWLLAGTVAIIGAFVPRTNDRWGLDALSFVYFLWAGASLIAGITGLHSGLLLGAIHATLFGVVWLAANMRRVDRARPE